MTKYSHISALKKKLVEYNSWIVQHPHDVDVYLERGKVLVELSQYKEALQNYNIVLLLDPKNTKVLTEKIKVLFKLKMYEQVIETYIKILHITPNYFKINQNKNNYLFNIGTSYLRSGKYVECFRIYNQFRKSDAVYQEVDKIILNLKGSQKHIELIKLFNNISIVNFEEKIKDSLKDEIISILLNYLKEGNNSKKQSDVIQVCDFLLEINPNNVEPLKTKGFALFILKSYDQALKIYEKVLDIDPKNADSWCITGDILSEIKQYDEALEAYERALMINPGNSKLLCLKGDTLLKLEKNFEALAAYEQVLKINPYWAEIWRKKGNILSKLGFLDDAIEAYSKLEELNKREESGKIKEWYEVDNPINKYHLYK